MKTIKIGRSKTNDCIFGDQTVSGSHALLIVEDSGERGRLKDLNSTNGTFVNNRRVTVETPVTASDIIRFGSVTTTLREIVSKLNETGMKNETRVKPVMPGVDRRTIGKNPNCNIRLTQDDVSREHAVIYKTETGAVVIEDRNSTNGTYVNGIKITSKELHPGDKVTITRNYPLDWESIFKPQAYAKSSQKFGWQKIAAIFLVAVLLIGGGIWAGKVIRTMPPEKIYEMYKKTVVFVYNQYTFQVTVEGTDINENYYIDENGELKEGVIAASGTGFFVSSDGRIATNKHVVTLMGREEAMANYIKSYLSRVLLNNYGPAARPIIDAMRVQYVQSISIAMNDAHLSSEKDLLPCTLIKASDNNDLDVAVIQLNTKETPSSVTKLVDMNKIAGDKQLSMGKTLYAIGFPNGLEWALTEQGMQATVEGGSVNQSVNEFLYGHNINITHGASGSPVFDTKGRFAGIIVSGAEFQSVSPSGEIEKIPAQHNQAIKPKPAAEFIKNVY